MIESQAGGGSLRTAQRRLSLKVFQANAVTPRHWVFVMDQEDHGMAGIQGAWKAGFSCNPASTPTSIC